MPVSFFGHKIHLPDLGCVELEVRPFSQPFVMPRTKVVLLLLVELSLLFVAGACLARMHEHVCERALRPVFAHVRSA